MHLVPVILSNYPKTLSSPGFYGGYTPFSDSYLVPLSPRIALHYPFFRQRPKTRLKLPIFTLATDRAPQFCVVIVVMHSPAILAALSLVVIRPAGKKLWPGTLA